eukprot:CAMPEP_0181252166 /NCGR_PEP_ID=MMETSP1096-20121128/47313_1 /TAXON_ID=156174 ORGANISM="Chrysochromulina ericina, Strain CCMP281" /NCGR_SAMPLE_ID=MMETSP1096 /ASSEMBLY_ACC=CAM_ASM_000453 /LENGTH=58 /DNA_ID=CAMNT_0023349893 /DNA_START=518 /DNA_END=694 /DNA_ORIENTATION=+
MSSKSWMSPLLYGRGADPEADPEADPAAAWADGVASVGASVGAKASLTESAVPGWASK